MSSLSVIHSRTQPIPGDLLEMVRRSTHPADQHELEALGYPLTFVPDSRDPGSMSGVIVVDHPDGRVVIPYTAIYDGDVLLDASGIHWYDDRPGSDDAQAIIHAIQEAEQQWRSLIALLP